MPRCVGCLGCRSWDPLANVYGNYGKSPLVDGYINYFYGHVGDVQKLFSMFTRGEFINSSVFSGKNGPFLHAKCHTSLSNMGVHGDVKVPEDGSDGVTIPAFGKIRF